MSIQRMRSRFARQLRIALYILIGAFIIGLPLMFAMPGGPLNREGPDDQQTTGDEVIARVNDIAVTRAELNTQFDLLIGQVLPIYAQVGQPVGVERLWQFRLNALEQAIAVSLIEQDAAARGLEVSKGELRMAAEQSADRTIQTIKQNADSAQLEFYFARIVAEHDPAQAREKMKERDFRKWLVEQELAPDGPLQSQLLEDKLRPMVIGEVSATEQELLESYDTARIRHILVTTRQPDGEERTKEEARARAEEFLARIRAGESFEKIAREASDDPALADTEGLIEDMKRGRMPDEWDAAVFALEPGQVSDVIQLPWGYEIVEMESIERKLPDDFSQNKERLLAGLTEQKRSDAWNKYVEALREETTISYEDPEMLAYEALEQGDQEEALAKLEQAAETARVEHNLGTASVFFQLATLYASRNEWEKAAEAYAEAGDSLLKDGRELVPGGRAQALLGMGRSYENLGDIEEAVMWYTAASDATEIPSLHSQLEMTFRRLGQDELVERETQWLADFTQRQKERQEALAAQQKAMEEQQARPRPPEEEGAE